MTRRTLIGALGLAAVAALIAPQVASAHSVAVTCADGQVTAQGRAFPVSPLVTEAQLTVDGVPGPLLPVSPGIPGPNPRYVFPGQLFGAHTLVASLINGGTWTSPATPVFCGSAPPPPPVEIFPVPGPGPLPPPPAARELTCAEKLALYPRAGKARKIGWGCAVPKFKPPAPKKPRRPICRDGAFLIAVPGTPPAKYRWTCARQRSRPFLPPVTG